MISTTSFPLSTPVTDRNTKSQRLIIHVTETRTTHASRTFLPAFKSLLLMAIEVRFDEFKKKGIDMGIFLRLSFLVVYLKGMEMQGIRRNFKMK